MEENSSNVSVVGLHRIYKDKERTEKMRLSPPVIQTKEKS